MLHSEDKGSPRTWSGGAGAQASEPRCGLEEPQGSPIPSSLATVTPILLVMSQALTVSMVLATHQ